MTVRKNSPAIHSGAFASLLMAGTLALGGCASEKTWKESKEDESITTANLDIQNFNNTAERLTQKMLTAPRVSNELAVALADKKTLPLVKVSRIKNDTTLKVNMIDFLVTPIEEVLVNSGKVDFFSEDRIGQDIDKANELLKRGNNVKLPDFVLHGTVTKLSSSAGNVSQEAYVFQLRLTKGNAVVWLGSDQIIKQGR